MYNFLLLGTDFHLGHTVAIPTTAATDNHFHLICKPWPPGVQRDVPNTWPEVKNNQKPKHFQLTIADDKESGRVPCLSDCLLNPTWCCRAQSRPWRSAAACCLWWRRGSWLLSRWQRTGQASIWSPTWTGPGRGRNLGICCTPAAGRSTFAAGRCSLCNPVEMTSCFAYFMT